MRRWAWTWGWGWHGRKPYPMRDARMERPIQCRPHDELTHLAFGDSGFLFFAASLLPVFRLYIQSSARCYSSPRELGLKELPEELGTRHGFVAAGAGSSSRGCCNTRLWQQQQQAAGVFFSWYAFANLSKFSLSSGVQCGKLCERTWWGRVL